ncbi:MAG: class I SAM-dependent methyltransferase [Velocimicrobium sp.]
MYEKIVQYVRDKPEIYTQYIEPFWDDEHISKSILAAHLNPNQEGGSRERAFIIKSAKWISSLSKTVTNKALLDLGCGAGIYAEEFAKAGFCVTGIDLSKRSIDYAKQSARKQELDICYYNNNYMDVEFDKKFDVVTLIYCDFGALSKRERHRLLGKIKDALKPNGILIIDGFTESQLEKLPKLKIVNYADSGIWSEVPHVLIEQYTIYSETKNYLGQYIIIEENNCKCYNVWNQIFDRESFEEELKKAGFCNNHYFDNVCGKAYSNDSDTICVVAQQ